VEAGGMRRTVLRGACGLLGEELRFEKRPLDVAVADGTIAGIGPAGSLQGDEVVDLAGRMLVPGLINGHFHSHEHFQRGRIENLPLELSMHYVGTPVPVNLTPRQTYLRPIVGNFRRRSSRRRSSPICARCARPPSPSCSAWCGKAADALWARARG